MRKVMVRGALVGWLVGFATVLAAVGGPPGPSGGAPVLGTVAELVEQADHVAHHVQLWQVSPEHLRAGRWEIRMRQAAAGARGAFCLTAWTDTDGDGLPDSPLGKSELRKAKVPGEWTSWQFVAKNGPIFVGNCWPQEDELIHYRTGRFPEGYVGLGNVNYYANQFDGTPDKTAVPRFTCIVVQYLGPAR